MGIVCTKGFAFSGNVLAGYGFLNSMYLAVNYDLGFNNLSPDLTNKSPKTPYLGVRIGYKLGSSKSMKKK